MATGRSRYGEPDDRNPGVGTGSRTTSGSPPPGTTSSTSTRKPLGGVDENYRAPAVGYGREEMGDIRFRRPPSPYMYDRAPTYYDGDEALPQNYNPARISRIQAILHGIGMLGDYRNGVWDDETMKAYAELLGYSNRRGITADMALVELQRATESTGTFGRGGRGHFDPDTGEWVIEDPSSPENMRAPLVIRQTDPMYLEQVFDQAVIQTLGVGMSRDQIKQMVSSYNQMEAQRQQQAYDMEMTGGTVIDVPSPESFAINAAETQDPAKAEQSKFLNTVQDTIPLLSGTAWGV